MLGNKNSSKAATDRDLLQNSVKTLVANIRFASVDNPVRTIVVTSSVPNEGKSSVSVALAEALAQSGKNALIVECDMRRRSLANMLGAHAKSGIYSVLAGQVAIEDAVVKTSTRGLYFLDSEPHIPNPVDILASKRFRALVEQMSRTFSYVVIDTPPISAFVDGAVASAVADATLLVVRRNFTRRDEIVASYDQLQKAGANVIGTVLNFCEEEKSEYYYSYYNKDGKRVKKSRGHSEPAPQLPDMPLSAQAPLRPAPGPSRAAAPSKPTAPAAKPAPQANTPLPKSAPLSASAGAAPAPAASARGEKLAPGLKPLPSIDLSPADSTMAFLKQSGYQPRTNFDE